MKYKFLDIEIKARYLIDKNKVRSMPLGRIQDLKALELFHSILDNLLYVLEGKNGEGEELKEAEILKLSFLTCQLCGALRKTREDFDWFYCKKCTEETNKQRKYELELERRYEFCEDCNEALKHRRNEVEGFYYVCDKCVQGYSNCDRCYVLCQRNKNSLCDNCSDEMG
jgi:hypothetical protein